MRFIDLFAGLGGFHQALNELGHECVFASEKKEHLATLYEKNYGLKPNRNIRFVEAQNIPDHDILCAGFPCQPFSKAGKQDGLDDEINGSFFDVIVNILEVKKAHYFILENVRNIESHDDFKTWAYIEKKLKGLGYDVKKNVMSPHHYNIPQHRERLFIVGALGSLDGFQWPERQPLQNTVYDFLSETNFVEIDNERKHVIDIWQQFVDTLPGDKALPGFPIWSMEFGADYPTDKPISKFTDKQLERYKGNFGVPLKGMSYEDKLKNLPGYAVKNKGRETYPDWKVRWINANRLLWRENEQSLKPIVEKLTQLTNNSWKKFEWNCGNVNRKLNEYIIQFRASGVRIKRADFFPSLVTVSTQIPIIGWQNRYITPEEGARIQSFGDIELPENLGACFGALGNAVNVRLVQLVAERLLQNEIQANLPIVLDNLQCKAS